MMPTLPITEADVTAQCLIYLACHGVVLQRRNVGGFRNASGKYVAFGEKHQADYYGAVNGRMIDLEFKRTDYKPYGRKKREDYAGQIAWLNERNREGAIGLMIDRLEYLQALWPWIMADAQFHVHDDGTVEVL